MTRVEPELIFKTDEVRLYHGDCRSAAALGITADLIVADPPYGSTPISWDIWPPGWARSMTGIAPAMWCFGSMRMLGERWAELAADWRFSHDVVWEKHNGSGFAADRFRKVHEHVTHWYRGPWAGVRHEVPIVEHEGPYRGTRKAVRTDAAHLGVNNGHDRPWLDTGKRLMRSVIKVRSMHGSAIHPTEKPTELLDSLIRYGCAESGTVFDPFAGSGSTAVAALAAGRRAVLFEGRRDYCDAIVARLEAL